MENKLYEEFKNAIIEKTERCTRSDCCTANDIEKAKDSLKRLSQIVELLKIDDFLYDNKVSCIQECITTNIKFLDEKFEQWKREKADRRYY